MNWWILDVRRSLYFLPLFPNCPFIVFIDCILPFWRFPLCVCLTIFYSSNLILCSFHIDLKRYTNLTQTLLPSSLIHVLCTVKQYTEWGKTFYNPCLLLYEGFIILEYLFRHLHQELIPPPWMDPSDLLYLP